MLVQRTSDNMPVERFRADLRSACGQFDIRINSGKHQAWGGISTALRADFELARVATDLQQIIRTSRNVRRDQGENYFLIMQQEGRALMAQNGSAVMLLPGDIVIIDSAKPSEFTFFGDRSCQISLHLPRTEVQDRFGGEIRTGLSMSSTDPTARALHAVVQKVIQAEEGTPQTSFLREALFGLLGVFLFDQSRGLSDQRSGDTGAGGPLLARALDVIETGFHNSEFSVNNIAESLGVNSRQVQRAFETLGVTPTKFLLAKRLESARAGLERRLSGQSEVLISEIAYDSGFSDLSYFNRRFRQAFGCAPGAYGPA
jgi:AraC family transcriptional regulator, positive regulator of tynA and feaB